MSDNSMLVRLKPYDKKRGHTLRSYSYAGIKFLNERGWYRVDADIADYLANVVHQDTQPNSPLAFDVCSPEKAEALTKRESLAHARATGPAPATEPVATARHHVTEARRPRSKDTGTLTTRDLPAAPDVSTRSPSFDSEPETFPGDDEGDASDGAPPDTAEETVPETTLDDEAPPEVAEETPGEPAPPEAPVETTTKPKRHRQ